MDRDDAGPARDRGLPQFRRRPPGPACHRAMAAAAGQRDRGVRCIHGKPCRRAGFASRESRRRRGVHADLRAQRDDRSPPRPSTTSPSSRRHHRSVASSLVPGTTEWHSANPHSRCTSGGAANCTGTREAMSVTCSPAACRPCPNGFSVTSVSSRAIVPNESYPKAFQLVFQVVTVGEHEPKVGDAVHR